MSIERIQIMVVDDSPGNLLLLEDILKSKNYDVLAVSSAREALKLLETNKPSLILLDIMMPGMDGYIFLNKVVDRPETSHIPVIMVSARNDDGAIRKAYALGASGFLVKPIVINQLLDEVGSYLSFGKNSRPDIQKMKYTATF